MVLAQLDIDKGKISSTVTLPSGGDTSYPDLVWHKEQLWISYYSTHEGKNNMYLAQVHWS
ncbi:MAG: hypothetical protein NZU63_00965 [Gemmataceae bacterium]|nr:hypothetical protein [Gemmataceae bacterium]MDW8241795.1 hypothetical protein [Thermogemmata sp.]